MAVSKTTRTHLVYQFIILTLLFLGIGYNELLPDRKFILFITFVPLFCYQLFILSCCMELLPIPAWMNFVDSTSGKTGEKEEKTRTASSPAPPTKASHVKVKKSLSDLPEIADRARSRRRWEKSVTNIRQSPKHAYPQKSKSWMNLSDSKSDSEKNLSREGSLDVLDEFPKKIPKIPNFNKVLPVLNKDNKKKYREERADKGKSWKLNSSDFAELDGNVKIEQPTKVLEKEQIVPLLCCSAEKQDDSELAKSYSFPFRQKRLETWLDMKEGEMGKPNQDVTRPYWDNASYKLAVKYEARRRKRALSTPTEGNESEITLQNNFHKSVEITTDSGHKASQKKPVKSAAACISKIKTSFSNLIAKKKDEASQNSWAFSTKVSKPVISKFKNKNLPVESKKDEKITTMQEFPQFLSTGKPLIFYPKHLPFEKGRFESDVQQKIIELEHD